MIKLKYPQVPTNYIENSSLVLLNSIQFSTSPFRLHLTLSQIQSKRHLSFRVTLVAASIVKSGWRSRVCVFCHSTRRTLDSESMSHLIGRHTIELHRLYSLNIWRTSTKNQGVSTRRDPIMTDYETASKRRQMSLSTSLPSCQCIAADNNRFVRMMNEVWIKIGARVNKIAKHSYVVPTGIHSSNGGVLNATMRVMVMTIAVPNCEQTTYRQVLWVSLPGECFRRKDKEIPSRCL